MIEPHSAQDGASSWILKATFGLPSPRLTGAGFPFPSPWPLWPFARTASTSAVALLLVGGGSAATAVAFGASVGGSSGRAGPAVGEEVPTADPPLLMASSTADGPSSGPGAEAEAADARAGESEIDGAGEGDSAGESPTSADRSMSPSMALSSGPRKREPSQRKM